MKIPFSPLWRKIFHPSPLWIGVRIFIGICILCGIASWLEAPLIIAPLAASCGLVFTNPVAQTGSARHVIVGHAIAMIIGLLASYSNLNGIGGIACAGVFTVLLMEWTHTVHPPACATAVIVVANHAKIGFALHIMVGAIALMLTAFLLNKLPNILLQWKK